MKQIPRGERTHFVRTAFTLPPEMIDDLHMLSLKRRKDGFKDTDLSSLVRWAIHELLLKNGVTVE